MTRRSSDCALEFLSARVLSGSTCSRVRLPDGKVFLVEPEWSGLLDGFNLLSEELVLAMCQQMPIAAVARMVALGWHRVYAICSRYVDLAMVQADLSAVAIVEISCKRGHNYLTLAADMTARRVVFVTRERDSQTIVDFAQYLSEHHAIPEQIKFISIDMSPAFIKGVTEHLPDARVTFDKFHVLAHASAAVDKMCRLEQKTDPDLKGLRWALLKDRSKCKPSSATT